MNNSHAVLSKYKGKSEEVTKSVNVANQLQGKTNSLLSTIEQGLLIKFHSIFPQKDAC